MPENRRQAQTEHLGPYKRRSDPYVFPSEVSVTRQGVVLKGLPLLEVLLVVIVAMLAVVVYMNWTHREDMRDARLEHTKVLVEIARTQHFFACIISIPMEQRRSELERGRYCTELSHWAVPEAKDLRK